MKTPLAIILTAVVLVAVSALAVMNNACKSGRHGWCAPMSALRQDIKLEPPAQYNHPYDGPVVERVMPVAEVRALCTLRGTSPRGVACSWVSDAPAILFCRAMNGHPFPLTADTKSPIAMVGRRTIPTVEALELFKPTFKRRGRAILTAWLRHSSGSME
jgi:hypothetical protein